MRNSFLNHPTTRREFLVNGARGLGLVAFARYAPAFLTQSALAGAPTAEKDRPILVLVQLAGGNDGLNTVIPTASPRYYALRPTLAIKAADALRIDDATGFHPACSALHGLLSDGHLAIVQNVGYPNPNRSHFRSTEIWETGSDADQSLSSGWLGRFFDNACEGAPFSEKGNPVAIHLSNETPQSFLGDTPHPTFGINGSRGSRGRDSLRLLEAMAAPSVSAGEEASNAGFLRHTLMDALVTERRVQQVIGSYKPQSVYPGSTLGQSLRAVASLIAGGLPTRVYFVSLGGFDTHANQGATQGAHANLLRTLGDAMAAFQKDLVGHGLADQVLTMTFSEFGRRPSENEGRGTDHGTAAPLFVMGSRLKAGLYGRPPVLDMARNDDPEFSTDFRQVYSTVLERWLQTPASPVLGGTFDPIPFI